MDRRKFFAQSIAAGAIGSTALTSFGLAQDKQVKDTKANSDKTDEKKTPPPPPPPPQLDPKMVKSYVGQSHGNIKGVKELVAKEPRLVNAAWDWQGGDWETGLGAASHVGNRDIANFLLDNGARIDVYAMAMLGQTELVKAILKTYPKTHAVPGPHGIPLISHAIYGRDPADDVFALLLAAGADVNQPTYGGMTPLMSAASVGRVEIVQQLLDHKSDPSLKDNKGKTALDHARNRKREKVVAILEKLTP